MEAIILLGISTEQPVPELVTLLLVLFCLQIFLTNDILIPTPLSRGSPLHFVELHLTLLESLLNLSSVPYQFFVHL